MSQYETPESNNSDRTLAFLVLRGWLGVRALVTGIEKYAATHTIQKPLIDPTTGMEDPSGAMIEVAQKVYGGLDGFAANAQSWQPLWMQKLFYAIFGHYSAIPKSLQDKFALEPFMPHWMTAPFYAILGPALILLGVMLLAGIASRTSLFLQGVLYIALTVGLILIKADDGVAWLGIHVMLIALALSLVKHNRLCIWNRF